MSDLRLVAPVASAWLSALVCTQVRAVPPGAALLLAVLALALLALALPQAASRRSAAPVTAPSGPLRCPSRRGLATLAVCVALAGGVATTAASVAADRTPPVLEQVARDGGLLDVRVTVAGAPTVLAGPGERVVVDVVVASAGRSGLTRVDGLSAPAALFVGEQDSLAPGEMLDLPVRVSTGRDGDREAYLLAAVGGTVTRSAAPLVLDAAGALRTGLVDSARVLPGDGGRLLPGLAVGDTRLVDDALDDRMTKASLSHLTAVSGANCALVVGAVLGLLALCRAPRRLRVSCALVVLAGFVVLVTPEPSVVRAATMAAIVLLCHGLGRPTLGAPVLVLAVAVCLLVDPWLSREFGFALSVAATAGLLLLAGPLTTVLARVVPHPLAAAVALPLAAQLACQPIIVLLDPGIPVWGVAANMLAAPAAPVVTVLGLASCLLLPVLPPVGTLLGLLAWVPAQWIGGVASATVEAPFARIPGPPAVIGVAVAVVILVLVCGIASATSARVRRSSAAALAVLALACLAVAGGSWVGRVVTRPGGWSVAMCDIGQGDAVLVRSDERVALVDTGPDPAVLTGCLADLGIGRIDLLVLTHFDLDHVGGVSAVVGRVGAVLHQEPREDDERRLIADLAAGGATTTIVAAGETGSLGRTPWRVLWPPARPPTASSRDGAATVTGNDGSVVMDFGGSIDAILLGDLGAEAQLSLLADGGVRSGYGIVKVAHHGSADQYDGLYERIAPALALVSVGADNDYGHPTASALSLLTRVGAVTARTDRDGLTLVAATDGGLRTWSSGPAVVGGGP